MSTTATAEPTTVKAHLRPIDAAGLAAFAAKGKANPGSRGTNKVHTVMEGQYRSLSYVGNHAPVVVDEPLHLFGQDTAPAPGEIVLSGLGGCIAVGVTAVATWKGVKLSRLEVFQEITENAVLYFAHDDVEEMAAMIQKALTSAAERDRMTAYGATRVQCFTFSQLAGQMEALYGIHKQ